jgi:hypothetical protein
LSHSPLVPDKVAALPRTPGQAAGSGRTGHEPPLAARGHAGPAASTYASCKYKGEETSDGGVVKQDDGYLYLCVNGKWVRQGPAPKDVVAETGDW